MMGCLDCLDMSPPPDNILFMPPPPAPIFLFPDTVSPQHNATPINCFGGGQSCDAHSILDWNRGYHQQQYPDGAIEYIEMSRKEMDSTKWNVSGLGDTWLLILVGSTVGVLILGALLAMFLLKCREMHFWGVSDHCSLKHMESQTSAGGGKMLVMNPVNASFYAPPPALQDNRMVWAAITPRGTEHFISENYSRNLVCYEPPEDHYETIENVVPQHRYPNDGGHVSYYGCRKDYEYEDPTPLIESYQMGDVEYVGDHQYQIIGNTDMRCASLGYDGHPLRGHLPLMKPRVSSPTRIEHPNLPPLNLIPPRSANNTLNKRNTLNYRTMDPGKLPKYGL